jgi:energy-coupling factor transport system substrate-specific component
MKDLLTLWKHTRMVVLVALTAAVYAAILIPFKVAIPIIPGFTEVRPANVIPVICSLMFGPAAAWGAAFGNLAGDIYGGTFGPGSAFGFVGNFLYGYVPYKLWGRLGLLSSRREPAMDGRQYSPRWLVVISVLRWAGLIAMAVGLLATELGVLGALSAWRHGMRLSLGAPICSAIAGLAGLMIYALASRVRPPLLGPSPRQLIEFGVVVIAASAACALIIAWGVNALRLVPFAVLGPIIATNNAAVAIILGPPLMRVLYPRVRRWGLLYQDVMPADDLSRGRLALVGVFLVVITAIPGLVAGTALAGAFPESNLTLTTAPLVMAMLIGCALL